MRKPMSRWVPAGLEVIALSSREWRVSDPAKAERDGLSLVGFVQQTESHVFELTVIGSPRTPKRFPTLDAALTYLTPTNARL